jgi:exodeoxyribonuclease VII small subunit
MAKKQASYEDKVEELEAILRRLDDAETPIDTLAQDVKKGASLIRELDHKLREVEAQVRDAFEELEAVGAEDEDE